MLNGNLNTFSESETSSSIAIKTHQLINTPPFHILNHITPGTFIFTSHLLIGQFFCVYTKCMHTHVTIKIMHRYTLTLAMLFKRLSFKNWIIAADHYYTVPTNSTTVTSSPKPVEHYLPAPFQEFFPLNHTTYTVWFPDSVSLVGHNLK